MGLVPGVACLRNAGIAPLGLAHGDASGVAGDRAMAFRDKDHAVWVGVKFRGIIPCESGRSRQDSRFAGHLLFSARPRIAAYPRGAAHRTNPDGTLLDSIEFKLDREHVQLNNLLKLTGLAGSGGAGKALVSAGGVTVDGAPESRKTAKIKIGQVVRCGDTEIRVVAT